MKMRKILLLSLAITLLVTGATAQSFRTGGNIIVENETGPLTVVAGSVMIEGPVEGPISVYSGSTTVSGPVDGRILIYSGNLQMESRTEGELTAATGNFRMSESAVHNGRAVISSGEALISGRINGDASVTAENLRITEKGLVVGDLRYDTDSFTNLGGVQGTITEFRDPEDADSVLSGLNALLTAVSFLSRVLIGSFILLIFPGFVDKVSGTVREEPAESFIKGLAVFIAVPVVSVVAAFTIIGIPFALLLLLFYAATLWLSTILGSFSIAEEITSGGNRWIALLLGLLIYEVLGIVPVVGSIAQLLIAVTGLGAVLMPTVREAGSR